ncbi:methyl-accepting chemotaxis protein [Halomonas vilamensis]|uniref:Methyl-accepting chemotaxis protein n=1 Tax=Vreelandella vilamensis TaxID=531309 RepID=A0ABU1H364_9GAMM|nr:methyl-accepting chemotaxis protein [Halomonas vilamensis]MDR5898733.1 methyl-accepting chemotaxis protein [Halomonas vilamensis]
MPTLNTLNTDPALQEIQDGDVLISKTDLTSRITYANQRFIDISGYTYAELHGSLHNIVRHPDMPAIVFADMWHDLQNGHYWTGVVKNRRKDGSYYWVRANVVPVRSQGAITGYVSIRVKAKETEIAHASQVYQSLQRGEKRYVVKHGTAYRRGLHRWLLPARSSPGNQDQRAAITSIAIALTVAAIGVSANITQTNSTWWIAATGVAAGAVLGVHHWLTHRRQARFMELAADFSLQLAAGNLTAQPGNINRRDMNHTLATMGFMRQSLEALITSISHRVEVVRPSVDDLTHSNHAMASRIEQQASAVQQTAASAEQISSTVAQSAENAQLASQASLSNVEEVEHGHRIVAKLNQAIANMTQQTQNMAGMVDTIDKIAFQTNLLALNASVEAARAGVHGRGFSVVAQEVRGLAEQSAKAAKQVQDMISQAQASVTTGCTNADEAASVMDSIREASYRVNDLMGEISAATQEQNVGVQQISQAINEIERATQDSAASMQRYNQSASSLNTEINGLAHSTFAFLPDGDLHHAHQRLAPPSD